MFIPNVDKRLYLGEDELLKKPLNSILLTNEYVTNNSKADSQTSYKTVQVGDIIYPLQQMGIATKNPGTIRPNQFRSFTKPISNIYSYKGVPFSHNKG
jgi:hypothetical protein